ncbi:MAG TPA: acyltransferase [Bacteroidetes bacterium]|nr:acyltransferase [Bacteroidota bacterium]
MRQIIEKIVNRLGKHRSFVLDPQMSFWDVMMMSCHISEWALHGTLIKLFFRQASGLVLVGRGVRIRHPRYLTVGRNFIIEDYAEIMALSKQGIICGDNVTIGAYATIKPSSYYGKNMGEGLRIGNNSNIGRYSFVGCSGFIEIGNNVMISPRVSFYAENHNFESTERTMKEQGITREKITIEDDCWIASGSTILAGVTVGRGSIVAAGSVVTQNILPYSIVAGVPARVIQSRIQA